MRKIRPLKNFLVVILIAVSATVLFAHKPRATEEGTESAVSEEEVKESLKTRIEQALRTTPKQEVLKRAWVGTLESIANHTLTIETKDGPKLASISAQTAIVSLPKRESLKPEELELGSYTIAMGYLNGNQVVNAKRLIVEKEPPLYPTREAYYVPEVSYDEEESAVRLNLSNGETQSLPIGKETKISKVADGQITEGSAEDLPTATRAIAIIKTQTDKKPQKTLLLLHILDQKNPSDNQTPEVPNP